MHATWLQNQVVSKTVCRFDSFMKLTLGCPRPPWISVDGVFITHSPSQLKAHTLAAWPSLPHPPGKQTAWQIALFLFTSQWHSSATRHSYTNTETQEAPPLTQLTTFHTFLRTGLSYNVPWIGTHPRRGGAGLSPGLSMGGWRVSELLFQHKQ